MKKLLEDEEILNTKIGLRALPLWEVMGEPKKIKKFKKGRKCVQCKAPVAQYVKPLKIPKKRKGYKKLLLCESCKTKMYDAISEILA